MSIPLTASTEKFTPESMAEIEGAPSFTFRHAKVLDKHRYHNLVIEHGLAYHSKQDIRDAIVEEMRAEFQSDGMEHNITRLLALWQADDDLDDALREHRQHVMEILAEVQSGDEKPELPPAPVLDFPEDEATALGEIISEVQSHSARIRKMLKQNHWHGVMMPRLMMAMFLTATTLPVKLRKEDGILTFESVENVIEALAKAARDAGVSAEAAVGELQAQAMMSYTLSGDEEKNSSSPRSTSTSPAQSQNTKSSGSKDPEASPSSDPATSAEDNGSISSE